MAIATKTKKEMQQKWILHTKEIFDSSNIKASKKEINELARILSESNKTGRWVNTKILLNEIAVNTRENNVVNSVVNLLNAAWMENTEWAVKENILKAFALLSTDNAGNQEIQKLAELISSENGGKLINKYGKQHLSYMLAQLGRLCISKDTKEINNIMEILVDAKTEKTIFFNMVF